jgi:rhamnosyltransferase
MLLAGWKIVYKADALAIHSHDLTLVQEFSRYFDIGVHHGRTAWLLDIFGTAGNQGRLYVQSEMRWLWTKNPLLIPYALLRTASKYVAYRLGTIESRLPARLSQALSNHPAFWLRQLDRPVHSAGLDIPHYRYKPKSTTK